MHLKKSRSKALKLTLLLSIFTFAIIASILPVSANPISCLLDVNTGPVDTEVEVSGIADTLGGLIEIYWDTMATKIGETYADGVGAFDLEIDIPEDTAGVHYIIAADPSITSAATVFTITPEIETDPEAGQPDDVIEVTGTGFGEENDIATMTLDGEDLLPDDLITDELGSFTTTFEVPDLAYGVYTLTISDNETNTDTVSFRIGATLFVTPDEGPTGTIPSLEGFGFLGDELDVWLDGILVLEEVELDSDGEFSETFVVPVDSLAVGDLTITATDDLATTADADFELTGLPEIEVDPEIAAAGFEVIVTGENFTAEEGVEVTVTFALTEVGTFETESDGTFEGTFDVPSITPGMYTVEAEDENDIVADTTFIVVLTYVAAVPTAGDSGEDIFILGLGFTPFTDFNVTIDGTLMIDGEGTTDGDGDVDITVLIPTLPVGVYTITVMDEDGVTGSAFLTVEATTTLDLDRGAAPVDWIVDVIGSGFAPNALVDVVIFNSTWEEDLDFSPIWSNSSGMFETDFMVPDVDLGDYSINATDDEGLTDEVPFSVVEAVVQIWPRASVYMVGDRISFYINCSFDLSIMINITDPTGMNILDLWTDWWKEDGDWWICSYSGMWPRNPGLPDDVAVGTYTWSAVDLMEDEVVASGTFEVVAKVTLDEVLDELETLNEDITSMLTDLTDLTGDVDSLDDALADLADDIGDIASDLADVDSDVTSIKGEFPVSVSVDQTPMWAAVVLSLIAALASIWSVLTVSRKIA